MLTEGQRRLASDPEAVRVARGIARRFARCYPDVDADEFESAALWNLCLLARKFDGRGRFAGFVAAVVEMRLKTVLRDRRVNEPRYFYSLHESAHEDQDYQDNPRLTDCSTPPSEFDEQHEEIEASIARLDYPVQRELVRDLFLRCKDGGQQVLVARRRGVSKTAVHLSFKRLCRRLREIVTDRAVLQPPRAS